MWLHSYLLRILLKVLNLLHLSSSVLTGIPRYVQGQWIIPDENAQYEDALAAEDNIWSESPTEVVEVVTAGNQNLPTTREPYVMKEQGGLGTLVHL